MPARLFAAAGAMAPAVPSGEVGMKKALRCPAARLWAVGILVDLHGLVVMGLAGGLGQCTGIGEDGIHAESPQATMFLHTGPGRQLWMLAGPSRPFGRWRSKHAPSCHPIGGRGEGMNELKGNIFMVCLPLLFFHPNYLVSLSRHRLRTSFVSPSFFSRTFFIVPLLPLFFVRSLGDQPPAFQPTPSLVFYGLPLTTIVHGLSPGTISL